VGDLDMMKEHERTGGTLQCCNKFHESILHTICRRGHVHLLKHILEKKEEGTTKVSIRLRDDYGRTPLHDAAWTDKPNFELVTLLLQACPDLLLIADQRGFTPMAYVGRQRWEEWCVFLEQNKELLTPQVLLGPTTPPNTTP
jgi:ankyrin repeat protein